MSERIFHLTDIAKKDPVKALKTVFYSTESTSGSVWVVQPGQEVHQHLHHHSDDVWICIAGEGIFYPEPGQEIKISKNDIVLSPKGQCHGVKNTGNEDLIFISIVAPVPSDYEPL